MSISPFFVGLGHPHCGTAFTAALLQDAGLDIGHERVRRDGIISWCLAAEDEKVPWGQAIGSLRRTHNVFCVARAPFDAIPDIIPETTVPRSYAFIRNTVLREFGEDTLPQISADGLLKAVLSYAYWYDLCLRLRPDFIYRVDNDQDDAFLGSYTGKRIVRSDKINRNKKPERVKPNVTEADYCALPGEALHKIADISLKLGYPADAERFRILAEPKRQSKAG